MISGRSILSVGILCAFTATSNGQMTAKRHTPTHLNAKTNILQVPTGFPTIQAAIDAAEHGDVVEVAAGVYTGPGNVDLDFMAKAITVRSIEGPAVTVLDSNGSWEAPHRGVSFHSGEGPDSVFEGFTIRNGSTPPGAIHDDFNGAGILCTQGSSPTIRSCVITDNWAGCWGSGICCSFSSHPTIDSCVITGNYSDDDGGGIFAWSGSNPTIINSIIANNEARITGGGISLFSGTNETITIINSTITKNVAPFGAGIFGSSAVISNSIIWGNVGDTQINGVPEATYSVVEGGYVGMGNMDVDPRFVDLDGGDFHLSDASDLIDSGDPDFQAHDGETDVDGQIRIAGPAVDIGADEWLPEDAFENDGLDIDQ